jgi:hypothetical protein
MKVYGIAALGLVAARPQPQFGASLDSGLADFGLGAGLNPLDSVGAPALDDSNQVVSNDNNANQMPAKKDEPADKVLTEGMREKHLAAWNKKKQEIHKKYSAAYDKAVEKEALVDAKNAQDALNKAAKKAKALQRQEEHKADEEAKKKHAEDKLEDFKAKQAAKEIEIKLQEQKLKAKGEEKKKDHQKKADDAAEQKDKVEKKHNLKKENDAAAKAKKEAKDQDKKDKADWLKWAHYHKVLFHCVKKVENAVEEGETFDIDAVTMDSFVDFDGCTNDLQGFDWANNFDGFKAKWNAMAAKMEEDKMDENKA